MTVWKLWSRKSESVTEVWIVTQKSVRTLTLIKLIITLGECVLRICSSKSPNHRVRYLKKMKIGNSRAVKTSSKTEERKPGARLFSVLFENRSWQNSMPAFIKRHRFEKENNISNNWWNILLLQRNNNERGYQLGSWTRGRSPGIPSWCCVWAHANSGPQVEIQCLFTPAAGARGHR